MRAAFSIMVKFSGLIEKIQELKESVEMEIEIAGSNE